MRTTWVYLKLGFFLVSSSQMFNQKGCLNWFKLRRTQIVKVPQSPAGISLWAVVNAELTTARLIQKRFPTFSLVRSSEGGSEQTSKSSPRSVLPSLSGCSWGQAPIESWGFVKPKVSQHRKFPFYCFFFFIQMLMQKHLLVLVCCSRFKALLLDCPWVCFDLRQWFKSWYKSVFLKLFQGPLKP